MFNYIWEGLLCKLDKINLMVEIYNILDIIFSQIGHKICGFLPFLCLFLQGKGRFLIFLWRFCQLPR